MVGMIRQANIWDAIYIVLMWKAMMDEIALPGRAATPQEMERFYKGLVSRLDRKDCRILVAVEDEKPVGFIMGNVQYYEYGTSELIGNCDHLYVNPNFRSKQLGKKLLDALISWGTELNATQFEFVTAYDEKLADKWRRRGYEPAQVIYRKAVI